MKHFPQVLVRLYAAAMLFFLTAMAAPAADCRPANVHADASPEAVRAFVRDKKMKVVTFIGYSGAEYEDPDAMLAHAGPVLQRFDPRTTLVNSGATAQGIGAVYRLAKQRGFATLGIVSDVARRENVELSPCVDDVFFVRDATWGGRLPDSAELSPTSATIVAVSDLIVGIGGGEIGRVEMLAARAAGVAVEFIPADMNHSLARAKAKKEGAAEPTDFRGAAHPDLAAD